MQKPKNKKVKGQYLTAYESDGGKSTEINIQSDTLKSNDLRAIATWLLETADWLEGKEKGFLTIDEFSEIVKDPMRILFESLRYEEDTDRRNEIVEKIEKEIVDSMEADDLTELRFFDYLKIINDPDCKEWREDFIDELLHRLKDTQPKDEIKARRVLYDYINLPDDDLSLLDGVIDLLKLKKHKKIVEDFLEDEDEDLDGIGQIIHDLYVKYPV